MTGRGRFITVEGGEGAGKSTCLATVVQFLRHRGHEPIVTREPGGTPVGERIRDLLLDPHAPPIEPEVELLLVFAARRQNLLATIEPALAKGQWVVSDRFTDASYAYQGGGRGIPASRIEPIETWTQHGLQPDLTLLLDVPAARGLRRALAGREADRFEREQATFYERVRQAYLDRAAAAPERFVVIDAGAALDDVTAAIDKALRTFCDPVG